MSREQRKAVLSIDVPDKDCTMDQTIVHVIQDAVLNDSNVQYYMDKYVRNLYGITAEEDVSDNEAYWAEYSRKLQYYVSRMITSLRVELTYDEVVF